MKGGVDVPVLSTVKKAPTQVSSLSCVSRKSADEIEKLRLFVLKVEETRATIEAEDVLGDVPDEFLGTSPLAPTFLSTGSD